MLNVVMRRTKICPTAPDTHPCQELRIGAQVLKFTVFSKFGFFLSFANFVFFSLQRRSVSSGFGSFVLDALLRRRLGLCFSHGATKLTLLLQQKETARCVSRRCYIVRVSCCRYASSYMFHRADMRDSDGCEVM